MRAKTPFILSIFINVLSVICVPGCRTSGHQEPVRSKETYPFEVVAILTDVLRKYNDERGMFPPSKDVLAEFCLDFNMPCKTMDWSKVSFQSVDDKKIVLLYNSEGVIIPISLERDPDLEIETSAKKDELEDELRESMHEKSVSVQKTPGRVSARDDGAKEDSSKLMRDSEDVNESRNKNQQVSEEISQVVQCLHDFLRHNKHDRRFIFKDFELNEKAITVDNVVVTSDQRWIVDKWACVKFNYTGDENERSMWYHGNWTGDSHWYIVASQCYPTSPSSSIGAYIRIEKTKNSYHVTDWTVLFVD